MHHDFAMTGNVIMPPESALKAHWQKCKTATNAAHRELCKADGANGNTTFPAAEYFRCLTLQKVAFKAYMEEHP